MGLGHELLRVGRCHARHGDVELDGEAEAPAADRAEVDVRGDRRALDVLLALLAPGLATAGPGLVVGAVEDDLRTPTLVEAEARMMSFRLAGFRAVRVTSFWRPGLTRPSDDELRTLRNVADAATRNGVRVYVTVMSPGSATTPLTAAARGDFAAGLATAFNSTTTRCVSAMPVLGVRAISSSGGGTSPLAIACSVAAVRVMFPRTAW